MLESTMPIALWLIIGALFIWLCGVTFLLLRTVANYNRLTRGASDKTLSDVLSDFIKQSKLTHEEAQNVSAEMANIKHAAQYFIQKIGMVRFNPFADTGGDQSFSIAFLDGRDSGVIMTSLYSRTGVRWYIKTIKNGKGLEHELSKEEKEALAKAKKLN